MTTLHKQKWVWVVAILLIIAALAIVLVIGLPERSVELSNFSLNEHAVLLLYAQLSNRVVLVQGGTTVAITDDDGGRMHHHAFPALSPDGRLVSYVRPDKQGGESIAIYDRSTKQTTTLLAWPGSIWSTAWSPTRLGLVFLANAPDGHGRNLYLADTETGHVLDLTPDMKWVSSLSVPSWSADGSKIAFGTLFSDNSGDTRAVVVLDVQTKKVSSLGAGSDPAWASSANLLAYISADGGKCYEIDVAKKTRRILYNYWNLQQQDLIGPIVWGPDSKGLILNRTGGIIGDTRSSVFVNLASGEKTVIRHDPNFAIVGWTDRGGW